MVLWQDFIIFSGWWYTYPSEKYGSQLGLVFPIYEKTCSKPPTSFDMLSSIRVSGGGFSFDRDVKIGRLPMFFQCLENQIGQCTRFYLSQDHYYVQVYNYIYTTDPNYYIIIYYHLYSYIH